MQTSKHGSNYPQSVPEEAADFDEPYGSRLHHLSRRNLFTCDILITC
jgi:hypothetical protein